MVVIDLLLFDALKKTTIQLDAILGLKWVVILSFGDVLFNGNSIVFCWLCVKIVIGEINTYAKQ